MNAHSQAAAAILPLLLAVPASAQFSLFGIRANGDLVWINPGSGAATFLGSSDVPAEAAYAIFGDLGRLGCIERIDIAGGGGQYADQLTSLWSSGGVASSVTFSGRPPGHGIRGMAQTIQLGIFVILSTEDPQQVDLLARLDGAILTVVGPTGRTDLEALAAEGDTLYALGSSADGALYTLDHLTGAATLIGGGGYGEDAHALEFLPDGRVVAAGANLRQVNRTTGAAALIGPTGFTDIRGMGVSYRWCYANCECGGPPPVLNVVDFGCFLWHFAAGHPYANCDMSTTPPVLNVADFSCFLQKFAADCQ